MGVSEVATAVPSGAPPSVLQRARAAALMAAVVAGVLWPVVRQPPRDSFPLSTYPMFSFPREPVVDIDVAVGVTATGSDVRLGPELIADTDEVIQAGAVVRRAVAGGGDATGALCVTIADRVAGSDIDADGVEVRTDRYDAVAWYRDLDQPLATTLHAACPVRR